MVMKTIVVNDTSTVYKVNGAIMIIKIVTIESLTDRKLPVCSYRII